MPAWVLQLSGYSLKTQDLLFFLPFHGLYSTPFYSRIMASFDKVIAISKTVEDYVNENYQRHLKSPPKLIYRGSDKEYFSNNFNPSESWRETFFKSFPNLKDKTLLTFPGRLSS